MITATHFAAALPIAVVALVWGRRLPAPYGRLVLFCLALLVSGLVEHLLARQGVTNLWVSYFALPLDVSLMLWMLAEWQDRPLARRVYRLAIPVVLAGTGVMLVATDPRMTFDVWTWPGLTLVALIAVAHTLVTRTLDSRAPLTEQGWFWVCLGLALFWISSVPLPAFAQAVIVQRQEWVVRAYVVRAWILIGAFAVICWGVRQPRTHLLSGHS